MGDDNNFEDLIRNPMKVNAKLEAAVAAWEDSIADLVDEQEKFLSSSGRPNDPALLDMVSAIRGTPSDFFHSEDPSVKALAEKAALVHQRKSEVDRLYTKQDVHGDVKEEGNTASPLHDPENLSVHSEGLSMTVITREPNEKPAQWSRWLGALSTRWSNRRKDISDLQGVLKVDENSGSFTKIKVKPSWPEWLVDTSYDVLKRSNYGKLQRRVLKLTQYHILNVRNGSEITKSFKYADITDIFLREQNSFVVTVRLQNHGLKSLCYFSSVAVHIIDQITTRLKVTRELDKAGYSQSSSIPDSLVGYSVDVTAQLISGIMEDGANDNISDLVTFATLLGELARGKPDIFPDRSSSTVDSTHIPAAAAPRRSSKTQRTSIIGRDSQASAGDIWTDKDSNRLIAFKENSNELALQKKIQMLMCDTSTAEFATRQHFTDSFVAEEKTLADIRMAIDGIYEVLVSHLSYTIIILYKLLKCN